MSGHSKWSKIKRQKGAADKKKGQLFSKLSKGITVAAKKGGEPELNPDLRLEVDRAKEAGMPADTIERAIKRGTGEDKDAGDIEEIIYEGYGPGGVGIMMRAATDNKNRTSAEIKHIFGQFSAKLGKPGSVGYLFDASGNPSFQAELSESDSEKLKALLEALDEQEDVIGILTNANL